MLFLSVVAASIVGGLWLGWRWRRSAKPPIKAAESSLHFGEAWIQERFQWTVRLENTTDEEVHITGLRSTCDCVSHQPRGTIVPPRGGQFIDLELDLRRSPAQVSEAPRHPFAATVFVTCKQRDQEHVLPVTVAGTVCLPFVVSPRIVDFGDRLFQGAAYAPQTVTVTQHYPLDELRVECDASLANVALESDLLDASKRYLRITLRPDLAPGRFEFKVKLVGSLDGQAVPEKTLTVRGEVVSDIHSMPQEIDFGVAAESESPAATILLRSASGAEFEITGVEAPADEIVVEPRSSPAALEHAVKIAFHPVQKGARRAEVAFAIRTSRGESRVLSVPVSGYVTSASNSH